MSDDCGPLRGTPKWKDQAETVSKSMRSAETKNQLEIMAMAYILDRSYSRGAICQAMHDVEIEKGWHT